MSLRLTQAERQGGLYGYPADSSTWYQRYAIFQTRVDELIGRFAPNNQKLAIWGCPGYLVDFAVTAGYDAYGFDIEPDAIAFGQSECPNVANRLFVRDATSSADTDASRGDAGLHGNQRFALLVTEDLLTCLTDAEIGIALPLLRGICTSNLLHILSITDDGGMNLDPRINWKSKAEWLALLTPPDVCVDPRGVQF